MYGDERETEVDEDVERKTICGQEQPQRGQENDNQH